MVVPLPSASAEVDLGQRVVRMPIKVTMCRPGLCLTTKTSSESLIEQMPGLRAHVLNRVGGQSISVGMDPGPSPTNGDAYTLVVADANDVVLHDQSYVATFEPAACNGVPQAKLQ